MSTSPDTEPLPIPTDVFDKIVAVRRDLHQHPELSWHEVRTSERVCEFLDGYNITYKRVAKTGVVAEIPGRHPSPYIALRADLDALPVLEETGLPFASKTPGRMHACGHDGHTSMLLGAAVLLAREAPLELPVRLIFQPAEETGRGAAAMVDGGVLENVAMIFGGHVDRHYPVGTVVVTDGVVNASSDRFTIKIAGRGGHAARPHETVDAVVVGSLLVMAIQTVVSREVNPAHPSVITVGRFDAGTAANVIAGQARLDGTIRAQDEDVRQHLQQSIRRISLSIAQLHGATVDVHICEGTPSLSNDPQGTTLARQAAQNAVGADRVTQMEVANMGGEDFSYYVASTPGCYVRFGATRPGDIAYPAHSSKFDFDEQALAVGAAYYREVANLAAEHILQRSHPEYLLRRTTHAEGP